MAPLRPVQNHEEGLVFQDIPLSSQLEFRSLGGFPDLLAVKPQVCVLKNLGLFSHKMEPIYPTACPGKQR